MSWRIGVLVVNTKLIPQVFILAQSVVIIFGNPKRYSLQTAIKALLVIMEIKKAYQQRSAVIAMKLLVVMQSSVNTVVKSLGGLATGFILFHH